MRKVKSFKLQNIPLFKNQLLHWANQFDVFTHLDSNNYYKLHQSKHFYNTFNSITAIGSIRDLLSQTGNNFNQLKTLIDKNNDWIFGHFSYDLKNEIEYLSSNNFDGIEFPLMQFYIPKYIFEINDSIIKVLYNTKFSDDKEIEGIFNEIEEYNITTPSIQNKINCNPRISENEYKQIVKNILNEIHYGNIYEINFCNEFYAENISIDPVNTFLNLQKISPTPFSGFYKLNDKYLISASPERFLKKSGRKILSQPIKGTIQRGKSANEDFALAEFLKRNPKERAENTMIVDLVRNDLSKHAEKGSIKVDEYCGIYPFSHVHQMISTISATIKKGAHPVDIIKNAFPMGSMTGAPKVKAMELIEKYEKTKRGLYSGSIGYFTPDKNFDFNVIIRSILYNQQKNYLNFIVGSAITANSIPELEYQECLVKAKAMQECLSNNN